MKKIDTTDYFKMTTENGDAYYVKTPGRSEKKSDYLLDKHELILMIATEFPGKINESHLETVFKRVIRMINEPNDTNIKLSIKPKANEHSLDSIDLLITKLPAGGRDYFSFKIRYEFKNFLKASKDEESELKKLQFYNEKNYNFNQSENTHTFEYYCENEEDYINMRSILETSYIPNLNYFKKIITPKEWFAVFANVKDINNIFSNKQIKNIPDFLNFFNDEFLEETTGYKKETFPTTFEFSLTNGFLRVFKK